MKVLFISSGNTKSIISPIVKNQGKSLQKAELNVDYFTIKGESLKGYLRNIKTLQRFIKNKKYDIYHAHYSLSGITASLAGAKPLVVSLMGSDVKEYWWSRLLIRLFKLLFWSACIVKTKDMADNLKIKNLQIIPNGVNLRHFVPIEHNYACEKLGWIPDKKHLLFPANPDRPEKNVQLLNNCLAFIKWENIIELHFFKDIPHNQTNLFYNATDLVVLTSLWEGSPNAIKEAMACNCPIVTTDVGDVRWIFGNTEGCYITSYNPKAVAEAIQQALHFGKRTTGRAQIKQLGLDSESVANKIIAVYNEVLTR